MPSARPAGRRRRGSLDHRRVVQQPFGTFLEWLGGRRHPKHTSTATRWRSTRSAWTP